MSTSPSASDALRSVVPFVTAMVAWILVTAVVYGVFVMTWPTVESAEPWMHLGVYLLPMIGYVGHVLYLAVGRRDRAVVGRGDRDVDRGT